MLPGGISTHHQHDGGGQGHLDKPTAQPAITSPLLTVLKYGSATQRDIGLARYGFFEVPKII